MSLADFDSAFPRIVAFDKRHGNDGIRVNELNAYVFSNGAQRCLQVGQTTALVEPHSNAFTRLGIQIAYHNQKLKWATDEFHDLKQSLHQSAKAGAVPPEASLDNLRKLALKVHDLHSVVEALKKERNETPEVKARAQQEIAKAVAAQRAGEFLQKLEGIRV